MPQHAGLSAATSISGNGRYRAQAGESVLALATCAWRGHELVTIGDPGHPLWRPELPLSYRCTERAHDWTGRRLCYRWRGGGLDLDLRTTLPCLPRRQRRRMAQLAQSRNRRHIHLPVRIGRPRRSTVRG
ncbi:MAG: hypothetical protein PF961_14800 [Planctomycetota bacterium]|nr:hypothetical protein [Planctomycetota bacterium]